MNQKENWIQKTLTSVDTIKRAEASKELYANVMQRLSKPNAKIISISTKTFWRVAACITVLIGLNIFTIANNAKSKVRQQNSSDTFANEYFFYLKQSWNG